MSDLLSGLRATGDDPVDEAWNDCLDGVREALRHPTDEQVDAVAAAEWALRFPDAPRGYYRQPQWYKDQRRSKARRWLAAAAGGDAVRGETQ